MAATRPCPEASLFQEMLKGSLAEGPLVELAEHLEDCAECCRRYEELAGRVVVPPHAAGEAAGETALHRVIEELEAAGPEKTSASDASEQTTIDDQPLDFLDPPGETDSDHLGRLGQYEITEVIGRGGMGIVLKGSDTRLNRCVAIKVLAPQLASNATARRRFQRESQAAAAVSHDHVVRIHAVDEINRLPLLVMEYVDGRSLDYRIKSSGPMDLKEILRIATQAASGLAAAHAQGLVHRDIKPSNILLENGVERVKITDFGLARAADDVQLTQTGVVAGTPQYMSPEQARGCPVDHRSDLFSLGSVIYAMCTGRPPFRAETVLDAIRRVCDDAPRPIHEINREVPDWLAEIIDKLLAKDADARFQSASEVADVLGWHLAHLQQKPDRLSSASEARRHTAKPRRHRRWAVAAAVAVLLLGGLGVTEATGVTEVTEYVATVLRIRTPEGILVVKIDDPKIKVVVDADGEAVTLTGIGEHEITLRPGRHQWQAVRDGSPAHSDWVTIAHGGKQVVTARVLPPSWESIPLTPREPASPHRRPRYFVRLVVGEDGMTFQGQKTSWEDLPALLEKVSNRAQTVLEFATPSEGPQGSRRNREKYRASQIARHFGFEYRSDVGVHPLGTKGSLPQLAASPDRRPRYFVRLVVGRESMTFEGQETSWEELPALLEKVPNRAETVLEFAMPSRELIEDRRSREAGRAGMLVKRFAFEYLSLIGVHPLGSKGSEAQLAASPHRRPRYFARLVVDKDRMTFEGKETTWEELPGLMEKVPNRAQTVLEFAMPSDQMTGQGHHPDLVRAVRLGDRLGFEYLSDVGEHPLGSKGSAAQLGPDR